MYLGSHNVKNNPDIPREKVVRCGQIIRQKCIIAGLQEIGEAEDVEDIMTGLGPGWAIVNESTPNPIVYRTDKIALARPRECPPGFQPRGYHRFHKNDPSIPTPTRLESWGIFKLLTSPGLAPFVVSNAHLVNKAWNGRERNQTTLGLRRYYWYEGFDEWQWSVNNFRRAGLTTIWMGDFNRILNGIPQFTPAQQTVASYGIDHMFIARGRGPYADRFYVRPNKSKRINTPSDHPLILGNISLLVP
jgi:hypothetical protein